MASVAHARDCQQIYCAMCAYNYGPFPGYMLVPDGSRYGKVVKIPEKKQEPTRIYPTPRDVVNQMLAEVSPQPEEVVYDLGCGDGRFLEAAIKNHGSQAVGVEINSEVAEFAEKRLTESGIPRRWRIVRGDATKYRYTKADIVVTYLSVDLMKRLDPRITHARAWVSYNHPIPRKGTQRIEVEDGKVIYVWRRLEEPPRTRDPREVERFVFRGW